MANHKSAAKRARQTKRITERTSATRSKVRTLEKRLIALIGDKKAKEAAEALTPFASALDKAAQKGIFHTKRAARRVGRLSKQVNSISK